MASVWLLLLGRGHTANDQRLLPRACYHAPVTTRLLPPPALDRRLALTQSGDQLLRRALSKQLPLGHFQNQVITLQAL